MQVLQERLKHLRGKEETESGKGKQPETESLPSGQSSNEAEMADILNLLVEVETKVIINANIYGIIDINDYQFRLRN